jgi:hypothetical protein
VEELASLLGVGSRLWAGQRRHLAAQLPPPGTVSSGLGSALSPDGKARRNVTSGLPLGRVRDPSGQKLPRARLMGLRGTLPAQWSRCRW